MIVRIDGGRLWDAESGQLRETSVAFDDVTGEIVALGQGLRAEKVIELRGEAVFPGFIDMHVHLRDPGLTAKESLETGVQAAAAGGFTQVACMPNTKPPIDSPKLVADLVERAKVIGKTEVHPIACITQGQAGDELADYEALRAAGAVGFSDDGRGVQHGGRMREAFLRLKELGAPAIIHAEDETISGKGVVHPNAARRLGLLGIPIEAEAAMIARDVLLAEQTGAHLHVCHVSTEPSVAVIRWAKARGIRVTAEVTPHHLLLSETAIKRDDANWKVNPPLQSERDREACLEGFLDGTLDIIATDHAPHTPAEKAQSMATAPFGMVGLETAFALLYTYLVLPGTVPLTRIIEGMTSRPARLFGLAGGSIRPGARADFAIVDLQAERTIDGDSFYTKGRNTPFLDWRIAGVIKSTIRAGQVIYEAGEERLS
ncbi:dihydroorotase, multifunctional complex type [Alicyclobacillus hesperidum URH17-3-68]|uniref:Dihydroorotase n=1 Tax=Alicyclobacillus hesperidum TaxID=89784 RepID=A0A1H2UYP7_9BACL|nr:dihydroorotase [Alicyclobacillus hesperidum]EJY55824.1 dihydroorotase, multifunctional complex type [Alicyclobacillus hesperidum URH17-3-68]GLV14596.1 dihydroorotase [Alicyclobacillus hesperidum]SDW60769.1 dihydroorotase [Alicyclobacillus hesperidum]